MKALLIEDDEATAAVLHRVLDGGGFTVDLAVDADDGLWRATEYRYDLLVLGVGLPGTRVIEICRTLRGRGNWAALLVLADRHSVRFETQVLEAGADDYLTTPFPLPVLLARARAVLRRANRLIPAPIEVDGLRLDPGRRRCWRGDVEITLTAREFAVLEYLMRRGDMVSSKFEILDGVWDRDFDGDPNIVEVYVGRLRRKVDEPFGRANIETVRGSGYRLSDRC